MSLYIVCKAQVAYQHPFEMERHIPFNNLPSLDREEIDFIQADGDELDAIKEIFTVVPNKTLADGQHYAGGVAQITIPMSERRVVKWYGEMAKFIYNNIR